MTPPAISIIIPNWNGKHLLIDCLASLQKQTFNKFETIMVDNGSIDGSVEYVKKNFPQVIIISLPKNHGFALAVNLGIKNAKSEQIMLLNNDTKLEKNCLKFLIKAVKVHPEAGFIATKMLNFYQPKLIDSAGDSINSIGQAFSNGFGQFDKGQFDQARYIFLAKGGGMLITKQALKKVGLLDERFFAYFEDVDWCFRAQLLGLKGWYEPKAIIYHVHMGTSAKYPALIQYLTFRNRMIMMIKDFPTRILISNYNWLRLPLFNLRTIMELASKGYLYEAIKAELFIILNLPSLLCQRKIIQSNRVVDDQYILSQISWRKLRIPLLNKSL